MPWNNDNNFGENANNNSPWDSNKTDPKQQELENLLKLGKDKFNGFFSKKPHNSDNKNNFNITILIIVAAALWLLSGVYKIEEGEQAVVTRFGKFARVSQAGLNFHLPSPIENVVIVAVDRVESEEIGGANGSGANDSRFYSKNLKAKPNVIDQGEKSFMLTGDENIIDINFIVQWKVSNIEYYIFNVLNPKETVRSVAESAMREVIGSNPIAAPLTEGKSNIELAAKTLLQNILDSYETGITITNLRMARVDPPAEVIDAFRDVQTARADKEREINQAQAYHNDIIPRARGEAAKITEDAEAYKQEVIAIATGEVSRFNAVYNEYKNAKQVTKQRIYLETMESILGNIEKIIIDKDLEKSILPYLPLPKFSKQNNGESK